MQNKKHRNENKTSQDNCVSWKPQYSLKWHFEADLIIEYIRSYSIKLSRGCESGKDLNFTASKRDHMSGSTYNKYLLTAPVAIA